MVKPFVLARAFVLSLALIAVLGGSLGPVGAANFVVRHHHAVSAATVPVRGGTLVEGIQEQPDQLLPNFSGRLYTLLVQQTLFAPLFYSDSHGDMQPGLASVIPTVKNGGISPDGRTYTIHLRRGLRWSDGAPLTARDIDFSWRLWVNSKVSPEPYSTLGIDRIGGSAISRDGLTITFLLVQPYAPFLSDWTDALQPLPSHTLRGIKPASLGKSGAATLPKVSSGPFTLKEVRSGESVTVVRNPHYYQASQGYPYLKSIVFRVMPSVSNILQSLRTHAIDAAWLLPITNFDALQRMKGVTTLPLKDANWEAALINMRRPVLQDVRVRQALQYGLNRAAEIRTAWHGMASLIGSDQPLTSTVFASSVAPYPYDPGKAGRLLDAAGWRKGVDGLRHKGKTVLSLTYSTTSNNPWRQQDEAQALADYERLGIQLVIQNYPPEAFLSKLQHGQFDLAEYVFNNSLDPDDTSSFGTHFVYPFGTNYGGYSNPAFDRLAGQEVTMVDPARRAGIISQMQQLLRDDAPAVWLYSPYDLAAASTRVHNYTPAPYSLDTWNSWQWWVDSPAR
ncbi:MAG: peptide transporter substrate-binding protein, partial [Chloroflexi bacterium]|nr:peptide transporter substrate-binding protein [Chloroflexota bacterium]